MVTNMDLTKHINQQPIIGLTKHTCQQPIIKTSLINLVTRIIDSDINTNSCFDTHFFKQLAPIWRPTAWWEYQLTKTVQNGGPHAISKILHIEYRIVCCIETYLKHIYHINKCSKCNWNRYIEGFCMWNVHFRINGLSPNIAYVILMSWHLMAIYFLLLNYWLFSVQFWYHI